MSEQMTYEQLRRRPGGRRQWIRAVIISLIGVLGLAAAGCGSSSSASSGGVAATVNNQDVPMSAYLTQLTMDQIAYADSTGYNPCEINSLKSICNSIKSSALTTVIGHEYIRQYAAKHGLKLSTADMNRYWQQQFQAHFHGNQAAFKAWSRRTGIPESDFRASVKADELQGLVLATITKNVSPYAPALLLSRIVAADRKEVAHVQALLRNGYFDADASLLQRTSPNGCSKVHCGALGWIPYPLMPADGKSLESDAVGTIVGPKYLGTYWDFLKVEGKNLHYRMTAKQLFLVREQVFSNWLLNQIKQASVKKFVAV